MTRRSCQAMSVQWPVGQGGFWTTAGIYSSDAGHRWFEFCFDCGTSTRDALARSIHCFQTQRRPSHKPKLDFLFVSHLDDDHASGLDQLLESCAVDTVVMPLLDTSTILLSLAGVAAHGALSRTREQMITRPGDYFSERGVRHLIQIQPAPPEGENPRKTGDTPRESAPGEDLLLDPEMEPSAAAKSDFEMRIASSQLRIILVGPDGRPFWHLIPYVHPFESSRIGRFLEELTPLLDSFRLGGQTSVHAIESLLRNRRARSKLKACYKYVRSDHNAVSLSLYSSPADTKGGHGVLHHVEGPAHPYLRSIPHIDQEYLYPTVAMSTEKFAWLHTGDSTLGCRIYRQRWLEHYQDVLADVGALVLPHHGSEHSFHLDLINHIDSDLLIACAGKGNPYKHPHRSVVTSLRKLRRPLQRVDQNASSSITTSIHFAWNN
jgi:hypothetical protein